MATIGNLGASSSSFVPPSWIYDVFLSFYGGDTRKGFVDHLHAALKRKGIITFKDDEKLQQGKYISQELLQAIQKSQYAIVVISKRYAFSKWCLMELTKIMECRNENGMIVLPVFYYVDPSDIRNQERSFAEAFAKHSQNIEVHEEQRKTWRAALKDIGNLSGWHIDDRYEATIVENITRQILDGVNRTPLNIFKGLVGISSRASELISLLSMGSNDVRFMGICGMGGIGKTTLANIIYDRVSSKFEASCFVANVREVSQKHGVVHLQTQLVCEILNESNLKIWNTHTGIDMIAKSVHGRNVFIVLDDVDREDQLKVLVGSHVWFGPGSRIIVTSRDHHLLKRYVDTIYEITELSDDESLELFCWKAFKKDYPEENYVKLSKDIVNYAQGIPLAIEVFGSYLFGRKMDAWKAARKQLKAKLKVDILDKLQISYEGLEDSQKKLFLDIACLLDGNYDPNEDYRKLKCLHHYLKIDIEVLNDRCLIKYFNGRFRIHNLLKNMGQQIVYNESPNELGRRSRLWHLEDIDHVLNNNVGTDAIEGIGLTTSLFPIKLNLAGFSKMNKLKIFLCGDKMFYENCNLHWYGDISNFKLSNELRYLQLVGYPLQFLPNSFKPKHLIALEVPGNYISRLDGLEGFKNLKYIDMRFSHNLTKLPDVSQVPNLKGLDLQHCKKLFELHPSLAFMKRLKILDLEGCRRLEILPEEIGLESLTYLNLAGCSRVTKFPNIVGNMTSLKFLDLNGVGIEKLPLSFQSLSSIKILNLCGSSRYRSFVEGWNGRYYNSLYDSNSTEYVDKKFSNIFSFPCIEVRIIDIEGRSLNLSSLQLRNIFLDFSSLKALNLSFLNLSDTDIPNDFSCLLSIKLLNLSGNKFTTIPASVGELPNLIKLHLGYCNNLQILPKSLFSCFSLETLDLRYCNLLDGVIPEYLSCLSSLANLDLAGNKFKSIPDLVQLPMLTDLKLQDCTQLLALPKLPLRLKSLWIDNCDSLDIMRAESYWELINLCTFLRIGIDLDGRPYKVLKQFPCTPDFYFRQRIGTNLELCKIMDSVLITKIPEWFNQRISNSFGTMESCFQWLDKEWHGIALLVIYQVHEPGTFEGERKKRKLDEHGNSNYKIFDVNNRAPPHFFCRFQEKGHDWVEFLPLSAPEVPSAGSNAFWVFISKPCLVDSATTFEKGGCHKIGNYHRDWGSEEWYDGDVLKKGCLDFSIESCYLNVEVECGAREVYKNDLLELFKVMSDISPHDLSFETYQKFFDRGFFPVYGMAKRLN